MASESRRADPAAPQPGDARFRLRDATAASHRRVDAAFSAFDLAQPAGYRDFLAAQHAALQPIEAALTTAGAAGVLADWPARRRAALLVADLADLGVTPSRPLEPAFSVSGAAALLGAIYVLEGSRFGGAVLARRLAPGAPARFLGAAANAHAWRALVASLDLHLDGPRELQAAVSAARATFDVFETAARRGVEPSLV